MNLMSDCLGFGAYTLMLVHQPSLSLQYWLYSYHTSCLHFLTDEDGAKLVDEWRSFRQTKAIERPKMVPIR